ncbi:unnamed protein product [Owenia fusiformis]|nr:unnamed protein product [Owenia fusiformis]
MYVTATSPYIFMLILLIRGVTLPGSIDGLRYYMVPRAEDWAKLGTIKIWVDAGSQIFFSMSIALGTLTALGSYNRFRHNSFRDTLIFAFANTGTSIFAGIVIFSVLGFMAYEQGVDIQDVAEGGPGLAFIAYPKALNQMPVAPLWSAFFFIMVILLGLDSQFVGVEGFIAGLSDLFPKLLRAGKRRWAFVAFVCAIMYLVGLSMVTRGGMFVLQLFDYYPCSRLLYLVAMIECIVVAWIYGVRRFYDHIQVMYGRLGGHCCVQGGRYYYMAMWAFFCPLFCLIMFILSLIGYSELSYTRPSTGVYNYPTWAVWTGWGLAFFTVSFIPIVMLIMFCWKYVCGDWEFRDLINPIGLKPFQLMPGESYRDTVPLKDTTEKYAADGSKKQDYAYANEGYKVDPNRF